MAAYDADDFPPIARPTIQGVCNQCQLPFLCTDDTVHGAVELLVRAVWAHQIDVHPIFAGSIWDLKVDAPLIQDVRAQNHLTPLIYGAIIPLPIVVPSIIPSVE